MSGGFECLNCNLLGRCPDTDETKLKTKYYCIKWEGACAELVNARNEVLRNFGDAALPTLIKVDILTKDG